MFSVACGGAHRVWYFKAKDKRMDKASFMFIRKENVRLFNCCYVYIKILEVSNCNNLYRFISIQEKVRLIMKDLMNVNCKGISMEESVELLSIYVRIIQI